MNEEKFNKLQEYFDIQIGKIKTSTWMVKALTSFLFLKIAIYNIGDSDKQIELLKILEEVLHDFDGSNDDQVKVKRLMALKDNIDDWLAQPEAVHRASYGVDVLAGKDYDTVRDDAVATVIPKIDEEGVCKGLSSSEPRTRYADFTFYSKEWDKPRNKVLNYHTLQVDRWYQLEIAIRVKPTGIPSELEHHSILDPKQNATIWVTVESTQVTDFEIKEPVQTIKLPSFGDSTENAWFDVRPLRKTTDATALAGIIVRLYFEFNLLEVVTIKVEIAGKLDSTTRSQLGLEKPISFKQERLEQEYLDFDNIYPRTMHIDVYKEGEYHVFHFFFQNNLEQRLTFTASSSLSASDLEDALINIRKIWYDIAMNKTFTQQLQGDKDEFIQTIRTLAKEGHNLWNKLFRYQSESSLWKIGEWLETHPLKQNGIVQVSLADSSANFVFPWSLIYDRPIPHEDWQLPDLNGFWGIRYSIEQKLPNNNRQSDIPVHLAKELKLEFMLWKEFQNAKEQNSMLDEFRVKSAGRLIVSTPPITTAEICKALLKNCDAQILYFYTHGYTKHRQADIGVGPNFDLFIRWYKHMPPESPLYNMAQSLYESIEQGKFESEDSWIELSCGKVYLNDLYDQEERFRSNPLVILNMCESAQVTPSLSQSFIHFFLDRGAKSVIGTECPMTIKFAHPFAKEFLESVLNGKQVGESLLEARRHFLKFNNPLGLAYTLFGVATTCFEPPLFDNL